MAHIFDMNKLFIRFQYIQEMDNCFIVTQQQSLQSSHNPVSGIYLYLKQNAVTWHCVLKMLQFKLSVSTT